MFVCSCILKPLEQVSVRSVFGVQALKTIVGQVSWTSELYLSEIFSTVYNMSHKYVQTVKFVLEKCISCYIYIGDIFLLRSLGRANRI